MWMAQGDEEESALLTYHYDTFREHSIKWQVSEPAHALQL